MSDLTGVPKLDATHYSDNPKNKETPSLTINQVDDHTEGSAHHPARHGRGDKKKVDHALELEDTLLELKHDLSKESRRGHVEEVKKIDKEISQVLEEKQNLDVSL